MERRASPLEAVKPASVQNCGTKIGSVGYSTPNTAAKEMLPEETREDKSFYPDADTMKHLEVYEKFDHKWTGIRYELKHT